MKIPVLHPIVQKVEKIPINTITESDQADIDNELIEAKLAKKTGPLATLGDAVGSVLDKITPSKQ